MLAACSSVVSRRLARPNRCTGRLRRTHPKRSDSSGAQGVPSEQRALPAAFADGNVTLVLGAGLSRFWWNSAAERDAIRQEENQRHQFPDWDGLVRELWSCFKPQGGDITPAMNGTNPFLAQMAFEVIKERVTADSGDGAKLVKQYFKTKGREADLRGLSLEGHDALGQVLRVALYPENYANVLDAYQSDYEQRCTRGGDLLLQSPEASVNSTLHAIIDLLVDDQRQSERLNCRRAVTRVITFNADTALEDLLRRRGLAHWPVVSVESAYGTHSPGTGSAVDDRCGLPIYHVHGYTPCDGVPQNPASPFSVYEKYTSDFRVFSDYEYWRSTSSPLTLANIVVSHALRHSTCVFVGLSMRDANLLRWLGTNAVEATENCSMGMVKAFLRNAPRNLACQLASLLPKSRTPDVEQRVIRRYNFSNWEERRLQRLALVLGRHYWLCSSDDLDECDILSTVLRHRGVAVVNTEHDSNATRNLFRHCTTERVVDVSARMLIQMTVRQQPWLSKEDAGPFARTHSKTALAFGVTTTNIVERALALCAQVEERYREREQHGSEEEMAQLRKIKCYLHTYVDPGCESDL